MSPPKKKKKTKRTRPALTAPRSLTTRATTTIGAPHEDRLIVVAQGIEFHNYNLPRKWKIPECFLDPKTNPTNLFIRGLRRTWGFSPNTEITDVATYYSAAQHVTYTIIVTTCKIRFHEYLEMRGVTPKYGSNVCVIYGGHARYGRGPCLKKPTGGSDTTKHPGNHWGTAEDPGTEGIFRMGYPLLKVPVTEILYYQYKANVAREYTRNTSPTAIPRKCHSCLLNKCPHHPNPKDRTSIAVPLKGQSYRKRIHPGVRLALTKGYTLTQLKDLEKKFRQSIDKAVDAHPVFKTKSKTKGAPERNIYGKLGHILRALDPDRLGDFIADQRFPDDRFWAFRYMEDISGKVTAGKDGYGYKWKTIKLGRFWRLFIVLHAGWQKTASGCTEAKGGNWRMDLGATKIKCKVFCHFGCSTKTHNYLILRSKSRKNWQRKPEKNPTNGFAYWTTKTSYSDNVPYWLYHILTYVPGKYDRRLGRKLTREWRDVLRYAVQRTNQDLAADHRSYRIF